MVTNHNLQSAGEASGYSLTHYHNLEEGHMFPNETAFYRIVNGLSKSETDPRIVALYRKRLINIYNAVRTLPI